MSNTEKNIHGDFDLEYLVSVVIRYWLIFAICIVAGFCVALLLNKAQSPVYEVGASVLIKPDNNQPTQATTQIFQGFGLFNQENNFQNKIQVLKSSPLISEAIKNLDFQISYFNRSGLRNLELYKNSPFIVVLNQNHPQPINIRWKVEIVDSLSFRIRAGSDEAELYNLVTGSVIQQVHNFKMKGVWHFGEDISSEYYDFKLILNKNYNPEEFDSRRFSFFINDHAGLVKSYQERLQIEPIDDETSVAVITLKSTAPLKAIDFVTSLTNAYLATDVEDKIHASVKTVEYIDNQLGAISDSLRTAEINLQRFRTSNQVMDISLKSGRVYDQLQELEREKANTMIRYKYYQYINEYFEKNKEISDMIAPSAMGIEEPLLNNLVQELTTTNAERVSLVENNQGKSPYLKQLNIKIDNLKNTIKENIKYILNTTEIAIQDLDTRLQGLNNEINKLPTTERRLLGYERKFNLNDAIYTFLLERRAEAQIVKASYMPGAQVIEPSDIIGNGPISPKKTINYILGLLLGFLLPFLGIRTRDVIQNKITENTDVHKLVDLPILGEIFSNNKKVELVVHQFPKSHIAESFRIARTGLNYFLTKNESSVLVITSSYGQEGKSFISTNLASSLASINKKTIILGFDLRKPRIFEKITQKNEMGLSSYLSNQASIEKVIQKTEVNNLDVIISGPIPPNPSELIASEKTNELFDYLKTKYEYIVVDTPPVGILSDTYVLMDKADLNIYVVRQNQTPRREFQSIIQNLKEKKFKNLCIMINDIPLLKKSKYGYDYYESK
jgi:tyrosine-protein kinase Etk/Wzc